MAILEVLSQRPVSLEISFWLGWLCYPLKQKYTSDACGHSSVPLYSWILRLCVAIILVNDTLGVISVISMLQQYIVPGFGNIMALSQLGEYIVITGCEREWQS